MKEDIFIDEDGLNEMIIDNDIIAILGYASLPYPLNRYHYINYYDTNGNSLFTTELIGDSPNEIKFLNFGQLLTSGLKSGTNRISHITKLNLLNSPPTANAGNGQTANEGQHIIFEGSGSIDADGNEDIVSYNWDFGDGDSASGQIVNHIYDDNGVYTATLTVTDSFGETDSDMVTITVLNDEPMAVLTASPLTFIQGGDTILTFSDQSDVSLADTTAGFLYSYDCTDDGLFELTDSSSITFGCTYSTSGAYSLLGRIKDKDGGYTDYLVNIYVQTPSEAIEDLVDLVLDMNIQQGISNSLYSKLEVAQNSLDDLSENNNQAIINSLQSFINAVEAQRGNQITNENADVLVQYVQIIISSLVL